MSRTYHHHRRERWRRTPMQWVHDFMTVPRRAKERRLTRDFLKGRRDPDATPMPLGNNKPHEYYW